MADVKISALPPATTPLTGSEVLPIVQSGVTSKVSVSNMTEGRTVSASTVLIGTTTQRTIAGQTTEFLIERPAASRAAIVRNTNDVNGPLVFTAKSRGTINGSYTAVVSGDALGTWNFAGSDGTADVIAASIRADVDGTPGTNDMPGRLVFSTTADGASTPTERMRINASGNVLLNTAGLVGGVDVPGSIHSLAADSRQINLRNSNATAGRVWNLGMTNGSEFIVYANAVTGVYLSWNATSWTSSSDERLKTDLKPIENASQKVSTLRTVTGRFKTDEPGVSRVFLIAQDVQAVLPEAVSARDDEQGTLGLAYTDIIPLLTAALKETLTEIAFLKARVAALEAK